MNSEEIIVEVELDSDDIEILKKGYGVTKETEHPDIPHILITKWSIGQEIEDALAEEENIKDVIFEPDIVFKDKKPVKVVK